MPRHPPYALTNLITIKIIILIWLRFYNKNLNRLIATTIRLPHYQVFKELLWESYSLKTKQNIQVASFSVFLFLHRKEVIHPHVLVGIPCYDFTPVTCPTLGGPLPYGLGYRLQVLQTPMAWRAVCTTPGNVFTPTFWFGITSDSNFMESSCRLQSELRPALVICSISRYCIILYRPL